ncbi:heterokaryon incompatibility protein-domain-containing protein, partial [Xylogone sp. PMI_703]
METSLPVGHPAHRYAIRRVSSKTPDYPLLLKWLDHCSHHHEECRPHFSAKLASIYLIDVNARSLVPYPAQQNLPVDYLALSYVWGATPAGSFTLGLLPDGLPATIEDAIRVTRNLQKQYLWADYVCIDPQDHERQKMQIELMELIYSASFATIISLEGISACEGLPRVGSTSHVVPQRVVDFGAQNYLLQKMRDVHFKLKESNWMKRGWTFQEGILSNRRLMFARDQVYYICNRISCSESFNFVDKDGLEGPRNGDLTAYLCSLRNPLAVPNLTGEPKSSFEDIISRYVTRKLTHQSDALNAVTGLLKRIEKEYLPGGFLFGMPRRNFRLSLLWTEDLARKMSSKNEVDCTLRNNHFPSWSWAGW